MAFAFIGNRVNVDVSGLGIHGLFIGGDSMCPATITSINPDKGTVTVELDSVLVGLNVITVPSDRIQRA